MQVSNQTVTVTGVQYSIVTSWPFDQEDRREMEIAVPPTLPEADQTAFLAAVHTWVLALATSMDAAHANTTTRVYRNYRAACGISDMIEI